MMSTQTIIGTARFGDIQIEEEEIFQLPTPIPGFEESRRFALLKFPQYRPFCWFQSVDERDVCLPVLDPWQYFPDYDPNLGESILSSLGVEGVSELAVYCVVSPHNSGLCVNLAAPIVLYQQKRRAGQFILDDGDFELAKPLESTC